MGNPPRRTTSTAPSTVSRRFIKASARKLKELVERKLDELDIVAVIFDGKSFKDDETIIFAAANSQRLSRT